MRSITGALTTTAITEYLHLWDQLRDVNLSDQPDRTIWRWTPDGKYSSKSAYSMLHTGSTVLQGHELIWKTWAPLRVKIFLWLAFQRRHWTGDRRRRHGLDARDTCFLCDQEEESIDHILATCSFTRELWHLILQAIGRQLPVGHPTTAAWWRRLRRSENGEQRKGLDTLFALVSWQVWKERNARLFREESATHSELLETIKAEADRWIAAGAKGLAALIADATRCRSAVAM